MIKFNISRHSFAVIPDDVVNPDNSVNIMFQYRWMASAPPEKAGIKTVIVYADSIGFNTGAADELFSPNYFEDAVDKILINLSNKNYNVKLGKFGISAFSGGGIALYNVFKKKNKLFQLPHDLIISDANYGGKATADVWTEVAKEAINTEMQFVLLYTQSLSTQFSSTTQTTKHMIKSLGLDNRWEDTSGFAEFDDWNLKPIKGIKEKNLIILETDASHGEAGKCLPHMWKTYLSW